MQCLLLRVVASGLVDTRLSSGAVSVAAGVSTRDLTTPSVSYIRIRTEHLRRGLRLEPLG
jgi:hypothetical protein